MNKNIYLDHAATTPVAKEVLTEMLPYFSEKFANPGSLHYPGLEANKVVNEAREKIAQILNCNADEIIFTSGGTESVNLAIKGIALDKKKGHIITSKIEHPAVLETCRFLEKNGFKVSYINVDNEGIINIKELENAIREDTILISVMYANNEIGTIQPIKEISKIAKQNKILFHTDACQAAGLDLDVKCVDLMTLNGGKIYGPKGIGILYKKKEVKLQPLIHGGGQEQGLKSGTENVSGIIGFAKALELIQKNKDQENELLIELRNNFIETVLKEIPKSFLNGHKTKRLANNANISFLDIEGESILLHLNEKGIYVSTGSACSSNKLEVSHVLDALGLKHDAAHGSIRFTFGKSTTKKDLDYVVKELKIIIDSLRKLSPIHLNKEDIRK
jgi:cysteine desulfurase